MDYDFTIRLPEGEVELDPDLLYTMYGETVTPEDIVEADFSHLEWLDQVKLIQELEMNQDVSILFHPKVVSSLYSEQETSPYWAKNKTDALTQYRRLNTREDVDLEKKRKMSQEVSLQDNAVKQKRFRIINKLVEMGYDRSDALETFTGFLEEKGSGVMNLTAKEIVQMFDEYRGVCEAEDNEKRYISASDNTSPCTLYLLKFRNKKTDEAFIKIGLTRRSLRERFVKDRRVFDIEIVHTVDYVTKECIERERKILETYSAQRYSAAIPPEKGETELLDTSVDLQGIIALMGNNKVL